MSIFGNCKKSTNSRNLTPFCIRLRTEAMSRQPSGLNAACHFRTLSVFPAWNKKGNIKLLRTRKECTVYTSERSMATTPLQIVIVGSLVHSKELKNRKHIIKHIDGLICNHLLES